MSLLPAIQHSYISKDSHPKHILLCILILQTHCNIIVSHEIRKLINYNFCLVFIFCQCSRILFEKEKDFGISQCSGYVLDEKFRDATLPDRGR